MCRPKMKYRIWQHGQEWRWQLFGPDALVVASGVEKSSRAARVAAFRLCLTAQEAPPEPC
jgi:hypothetical protein